MLLLLCICFFFNDTATTEIYTLSLHDALPIWRATLLRALADALEARRDDVVAIADRETALGTTRLNGELNRTCYQLRLFAEVLDEGSYVEAAIDHAGDTRSEEHTSELQSRQYLVCRLLLEKKKKEPRHHTL